MIVGLNYMSAGNKGADSDAQLNADFAFFKLHKITYVDVRLVWAAFYPGGSLTIDAATVNNYKRLMAAAERAGIKIGITFWTQPPHDGAGSSFYPSWASNFTNIHSNATVKARWIEWVARMVQELDSPAIAYWQTCNEPYGSNKTSIENWIRDTAQTIRQYSSKPVSARFILGWNPCTKEWSNDGNTYYDGSYFNPNLIDYLDFLSLTIYNNPTSESYNVSSRGTWQTVRESIANAKAKGKPTYIVEFGNNSSNEETQRLHYQRCIDSRFIPYGLTSCAAWAWQTRSPTNESYNVARGQANAKVAFYELERAADITPACVINADCPPGFHCDGGVCVPNEQPPPIVLYVLNVTTVLGGTTIPTGIQTVPSGTVVTIAAEAAEDYELTGWVVNEVDYAATNPLVLTMQTNTMVVPVFKEKPPPIRYPCAFCDLDFASELELAAHVLTVHPTEPPPAQAGVNPMVLVGAILGLLVFIVLLKGGEK